MEVDEAVYTDIIKMLVLGLFLAVILGMFIIAANWYSKNLYETETLPQQCASYCALSDSKMINYTNSVCECKNNIGVKIQTEIK